MTTQNDIYTAKQREVWRNSVNLHHRWNISYGATRSGKTYLDYYKIPFRIRSADKSGLILLLGNTKGTLERNILDPMRKIYTSNLVGQIGSNNRVRLFGKECWALGADKITQVSKLQGSGYSYVYGDEVATWAEDVFTMLKSRIDRPDACFDGTCNPENPNHWFKKFIDSDADIYSMKFKIDDNTFLDQRFVENLKKEYAGTVFYDRFIEGEWVAAEGIIYRKFADNPKDYIIDVAPPTMFCQVGVDFGGSGSAHTFQLTGFEPGLTGIVTLDEEYSLDELDPEQLAALFVKFIQRNLAKGYKIYEIFADSEEQVLIRGLRNALIRAGIGIPIKNAYKGIIVDRIRFYTMLMGAKRYHVMRHCTHTIDAFQTARWDKKKSIHNDTRLDNGSTNIDTLDAQEYSTEKYQTQMIDIMMTAGVKDGSS